MNTSFGAHRGQLVLLIEAAKRRAQHRRQRAPLSTIAGLGLLVAGLVGLGWLTTPISGFSADTPGGAPLELAFWTLGLSTAVLVFRTMERLFRIGDVHILAPLPIRAEPLFVFRLLGSLGEATLVFGGALSFFASLLWRTEISVFLAALVLWAVGLLLAIAISYAVVLYLGAAAARGESYGGFGPMGFAVAPGIALAGALTASLVFKQVVQDFLIAGFARGVPIGSAITGGLIVLALGYAFFIFKRSFNAAFARFYEADLLVMDQGRAYFKEGAPPARGWEKWLAPDLLALTRKERLQLRRRTTTGRLFAYLSFIILAIALYNNAGLPAHYMAIFPTLVIAVFANPWRQLYHPELNTAFNESLPLAPNRLHQARSLVATLELGLLGLLGAIAVGVGSSGSMPLFEALSVAALSLITTLGPAPWMAAAARRHPTASTLVAIAASLLCAAIATLNIFAALGLVAAIGAAGFGYISHLKTREKAHA